MTPTRTRWLWISAVVAIALATGGFLAFRGDSDAKPRTAPTCRLLAPSDAPPADDSTGIQIVERGLSRVGPFGSAKASMGVLLRNSTDKVAYRTLVTLDAVDTNGRTVIDEIHQRFRTQVVPTIRPGEIVAVGNASALDELTQRQGKQASSVTVTVQVAQWLEPGDGSNGVGKITATVVPGSGKRDDRGQGEITYGIESTNCAPMVPRGVSLVFRDASGAIVGGALDNPPPLGTCKSGTNPGRQSSLTQSDIPAEADLDMTAVTVYCDFDRPQAPVASGLPYN